MEFEENNPTVTVFCSDIVGLTQRVCDERNFDFDKVTKKVGVDGGKGKGFNKGAELWLLENDLANLT